MARLDDWTGRKKKSVMSLKPLTVFESEPRVPPHINLAAFTSCSTETLPACLLRAFSMLHDMAIAGQDGRAKAEGA